MLAANAILNVGTEDQKQELLPGIASGDTIATLAFTEPNGKWDVTGITLEATEGESGRFTLSGEKMFVLDGFTADLIVVVARLAGTSGADGISFFTVRGDADGLTRTSLSTMDMTRKQAKLEFDNVEALPLGSTEDGFAAFSKTLDQAAVALANEMMGGAQFVLDMSVQYAKDRVQFGRPIGSFQAIKHKCADMLLEVESGKSAAYYASWAAAEDNDELPVVAALGEGVLLRGVLPRDRGEHPDPRWHRLHVGAPRAPLLQAGQVVGDLPRRPDVPPRAARAAHRHLTAQTFTVAGFNAHWGVGRSGPDRARRFDVAAIVRGFDADIVIVPEAFRFADGTGVLDPLRDDGYSVRTTHFTELAEKEWRPGDVRPAGMWELAICSRLPMDDGPRAVARAGVPRSGGRAERDRVHGSTRRHGDRRGRRPRVVEALVRRTGATHARVGAAPPGPASPGAHRGRLQLLGSGSGAPAAGLATRGARSHLSRATTPQPDRPHPRERSHRDPRRRGPARRAVPTTGPCAPASRSPDEPGSAGALDYRCRDGGHSFPACARRALADTVSGNESPGSGTTESSSSRWSAPS